MPERADFLGRWQEHPVSMNSYDDDDLKGEMGNTKVPTDFECPNCNAHNPNGEPLVNGEDVMCNYCGTEFTVKLLEGGKFKLREA